MTRNREDAEDLVQETVTKALLPLIGLKRGLIFEPGYSES